jgi:TonB family protein
VGSMKQKFNLIERELKRRPGPVAVPTFLVKVDPWHKTFSRNLRDLVWRRRETPLRVVSREAKFWDDVFVASPLPWRRLGESWAAHAAVIAMLWGASAVWPQGTRVVPRSVFHSSDVIYYSAPEYLQPLNTGSVKAQLPQKADPAYAPQPIISVPPEPDNRRQTIVAPPNIKLNHDVPLPNIVAMGRVQPAVPMAATSKATDLRLPGLPTSVVAPPPEVKDRLKAGTELTETVVGPAVDTNAARSSRKVRMPEPAVVEPPPSVETASIRRVGDINIGHSPVIAPAPQLPVGEQRAVATLPQGALGVASPAVVPPPPSVQGHEVSGSGGRMIALNVNPVAPSAPVVVPEGNRRGTFAATPEGKAGATGTPEVAGGGRAASESSGHSSESRNANGIPPGLFVGAGPKSASSSTVAENGRPRDPADPVSGSSAGPTRSSTSRKVASEMSPDVQTDVERRVFAGRKSYAMTLNMPNLNSAGGSWVMHFVEQKENEKKGELVAPVATRTADPEYPLEMMRQNVRGTVILAAVINADGSVGEVRVLNSIDERLDEYASNALSRWRFLPALKDGNPVALQAVVMIPFRPRAEKAGF